MTEPDPTPPASAPTLPEAISVPGFSGGPNPALAPTPAPAPTPAFTATSAPTPAPALAPDPAPTSPRAGFTGSWFHSIVLFVSGSALGWLTILLYTAMKPIIQPSEVLAATAGVLFLALLALAQIASAIADVVLRIRRLRAMRQ